MKTNFEDLRKEYSWGALTKSILLENPLDQFMKWYEEYSKMDAPDSTAMIVSTVGKDNQPDSRVVLLKGLVTDGFVFYTNYNSKKGNDIAENDKVNLLFFWPEMERQIRVKGVASRLTYEASAKYFNSRPFESRVAAVVSPQSTVVPNRDYLEERFFKILEKNEDNIEMPAHWGGYKIMPTEIEFWQGRISRLHDRLRYVKEGNNWKIERLAP